MTFVVGMMTAGDMTNQTSTGNRQCAILEAGFRVEI
jgi:hypothetical protein